ncbi:MAG TPA: phosphatidate cytidylyltransferase [Solirubrobacteraceae bacterium]|nr:phosphatidate cytidylyltransferase [Solirubrobacteraceae bacterium]
MAARPPRRSAPPSRRRARRTERRNRGSDLGARVLAAIPLVALAIVLVVAGGWVFTAGLAVLAIMAVRELFTMYARARPAVLGGMIATVGVVVAAHVGGAASVLMAFVIAIPVIFLLGLAQPRRAGVAGMTVAILGVAWIGLAFAHAVLLRDLPHGGGVVVVVLVATFLGDTGAYFGGRAFGSRKLAPSISPNKTVEGLLIGILVGTLGAWFAGLYDDWLSGVDALVLGLAVTLIAPIGDLFESYIKREADTKDSGSVFGAHGGVLDRLDAVAFSVVVGYYVWKAMLG